MKAKTLDETLEEYSKYNTITKDEYNNISTICINECNKQREEDKQKAIKAFCLVCGCKECAKRNVTCTEYKEFVKYLDE